MTNPEPIPARLATLKSMSVTQLKSEWQTIFATPAPNNSRAFLESRLAYHIQELTHGGPDRETRRMLDLLADEVGGTLTRKIQIADRRNPVIGTRLIREWNAVEHTITVLRDGFERQGRPNESSSAIARVIPAPMAAGVGPYGVGTSPIVNHKLNVAFYGRNCADGASPPASFG